MTLADTSPRVAYAGDGASVTFAVPYAFFWPDELAVISLAPGGNRTTLARGSHYTVTGGLGGTGTVTLQQAPAAGTVLAILRRTARTQTADFRNNDAFPAESLERALDRVVAVVQESADDAARSVRGHAADPAGLSMELPPVAQRAGNMLGFDSAGRPIAAQPSGALVSAAIAPLLTATSIPAFVSDLGLVSAAIAPLLTAASIPAFVSGLGIRQRTTIDVRDYGAVCDGTHDDTAAIQAALNAAGNANVFLPAGTCKITSRLQLPAHGALIGAGRYVTLLAPSFAAGDVIQIGDGSTNPHSEIRGLGIVSPVTRTSGAAIRVRNGHGVRISDLNVAGPHYDGVVLEGGVQQFDYYIDNFEISSCSRFGVFIGGASIVQGVYIQTGVISLCGDGIYIDHASGVMVADTDIISSVRASVYVSPTYSAGHRVTALMFEKVNADTSGNNGFSFVGDGGVTDVNLTNCWAASNNLFGIRVQNMRANGISISNTRVTNNRQSGVGFAVGANLLISGSQIFCNSQVGWAQHPGISVGPNVSNVTVNGCISGIGGLISQLGNNPQNYGMLISAGTSNNIIVTNNNFTGNAAASFLNGSTGSNQVIDNNAV